MSSAAPASAEGIFSSTDVLECSDPLTSSAVRTVAFEDPRTSETASDSDASQTTRVREETWAFKMAWNDEGSEDGEGAETGIRKAGEARVVAASVTMVSTAACRVCQRKAARASVYPRTEGFRK